MKKERNSTDRTTLLKQIKKNMENWESHKWMLRGLPLKKKQDRFEKDYNDEAEWLK